MRCIQFGYIISQISRQHKGRYVMTKNNDHISEAMSAFEADMPDEEILYDLADLFKVFSDTTRIKILYSLMGGELCVADIAETIGATQSAVSHQLRILRANKLVRGRREGKQIWYSLDDDHVKKIIEMGLDHVLE